LVVDDQVGGGCNGTLATFTRIQAAVAAATNGDTIKVCPAPIRRTSPSTSQ